MKKLVSLIFVVLMLASLCACSGRGDDEATTTTSPDSYYEQRLYGEWKRENSDVVLTLTSNNFGTKKQRGLTINLYWEADAETILIKENQVGEQERLPYLLETNTLTIYNPNGTKIAYKRVK